jgi:uncharacterized membrane protein
MNVKKTVTWKSIGRTLRAQFIMGILVVVPIGATVLILVWIFNSIDGILKPIIDSIWESAPAGIGFGVTIVLIYVVGVIANNIVGKRLISYGESLLARVPLVRQLYTGIKQILESFYDPKKAGYLEVVLVEFPRKGMKAIGFVTNWSSDEFGKKMLHVFVPTSPNPTSGFLQIIEEDQVMYTKMSIDEALKLVVSAGRVTNGQLYSQSSDS